MSDDVLRELVLPKLDSIKPITGGYQAKCPAHEDNTPSLSVSVGRTQPVVLTCHAGCEADAILAELGLTWEHLSIRREQSAGEWTPAGEASEVYSYYDEHRELLFQVLRVPQPGGRKTFRQRVPDPATKTGWRWKLDGVRRVPYRLPELNTAIAAGEVVYIVEGERDVETLTRQGITATCNPGGAGKWLPEYAEWFRDANVCVIADADKPGQAHARQVASSLMDIAGSITVLEPVTGKDITDHLTAGHTIAELLVTWTDQGEPPIELAADLHEFLATVDPPEDWIIPGLLERGDRLIWTGFEGLGKSVVVRQLAVGAAAGVHPFTDESFDPKRVLFIDCENSSRQGRRHFRRLERVAQLRQRRVPDQGMYLIHLPSGIDLSREEDAAWLLERVTAHRPDLLICGPFYRLHAAESEEERAARRVVAALDAARTKADCALVVEHHTPHGGGGGLRRDLRPFGSSLLRRWPELGIGIRPSTDDDDTQAQRVEVKHWRGARDQRSWPAELRYGHGEVNWPWVPVEERE